jgi:hypothetical protein
MQNVAWAYAEQCYDVYWDTNGNGRLDRFDHYTGLEVCDWAYVEVRW